MIRFDYSSDKVREEIEAPQQRFEPLPEGEYKVSVFEFTPGEYKSAANQGKKNIRVQFRVMEGEHTGRFLWETIPLFDTWGSGKPAYSFPNFFKAIGLWQKEFESMEVIKGKTLGVKLTVTPDDYAFNKARDEYPQQLHDFENGPNADNPEMKPQEPQPEDYKQNRIKAFTPLVGGTKGAAVSGVASAPALPKF